MHNVAKFALGTGIRHDVSVGFLDYITGGAAVASRQVEAAQPNILPYAGLFTTEVWATATRQDAMTVPAVARARNIICDTIGNLPLWAYSDVTGEKIQGKTLLKQPDPALPTGVTIAWTAEDLLFQGRAFWQILEVSSEDGRPTHCRRIDPARVTYNIDPMTNMILDGFYVAGSPVPISGVGSLIMFSGMDEGVLTRSGRTINTAINLEKAANRIANEPAPTMVLKNTGVDLPPETVSNMLAGWKLARQNRTTAYVTGPIDVQAFGFDASQMQLVEARQFLASEISRAVGIPAWYLNAENESMTYSNVTAERRTLIDMSCRPIMTMIEQRLSMDDVTPRGQTVRFNLDNYLRGNLNEQLDAVEKMITLGLITADEGRAMVDLAPRGSA